MLSFIYLQKCHCGFTWSQEWKCYYSVSMETVCIGYMCFWCDLSGMLRQIFFFFNSGKSLHVVHITTVTKRFLCNSLHHICKQQHFISTTVPMKVYFKFFKHHNQQFQKAQNITCVKTNTVFKITWFKTSQLHLEINV